MYSIIITYNKNLHISHITGGEMKKIRSLFSVSIGVIFLMILFGCDFIFEEKLSAPYVRIIGNVLCWDEVDSAESYDVYCNDELVLTTAETYYVIEEAGETLVFHVVAKNENQTSTISNQEVLQYQDQETMEIILENNMIYTIPSNVGFVKISGSAVDSSILIDERSSTIKIELDNVNLISQEGYNCISTKSGIYDYYNLKFTAVINVTGENSLIGSDYVTIPEKPSTNSGKTGLTGGEGGSGIVLPSFSVIGSGSLTLKGGVGGNGGSGADSSGLSTAVFGSGGTGGNGGYGIKSTFFVIGLQNESSCTLNGGEGGKGGRPGTNGSIITGPIYTTEWDKRYGKDGYSGGPYIGVSKVISGFMII